MQKTEENRKGANNIIDASVDARGMQNRAAPKPGRTAAATARIYIYVVVGVRFRQTLVWGAGHGVAGLHLRLP